MVRKRSLCISRCLINVLLFFTASIILLYLLILKTSCTTVYVHLTFIFFHSVTFCKLAVLIFLLSQFSKIRIHRVRWSKIMIQKVFPDFLCYIICCEKCLLLIECHLIWVVPVSYFDFPYFLSSIFCNFATQKPKFFSLVFYFYPNFRLLCSSTILILLLFICESYFLFIYFFIWFKNIPLCLTFLKALLIFSQHGVSVVRNAICVS